MTTWVFEGTVLPAGDTARLTYGQDLGGNRDVTLHLARTADDTRPLVVAAGRFLGLTGSGNLVTYDADPREHHGVLARPVAVVLNHRRIA